MTAPPDLPTLLIIEDDLDVAEMLEAFFRIQGYQAAAVNWGEDGLESAEKTHPDLIILDIRLPDIDGFEVAKKLRANRKTSDIPIIFLTEKRERRDRLHGLEIGGDDYITKPFDIQELLLRVRNALSRVGQRPVYNLITDLPEGKMVDERLSEILELESWALISIYLENLDSFREQYGFIMADDTLRAASVLIQNTIREFGEPEDLLGHLASDRFVVITSAGRGKLLLDKINHRFNQSMDYFYPTRDIKGGLEGEKKLKVSSGLLFAGERQIEDINSLKRILNNIEMR